MWRKANWPLIKKKFPGCDVAKKAAELWTELDTKDKEVGSKYLYLHKLLIHYFQTFIHYIIIDIKIVKLIILKMQVKRNT